MSAAGLSAAAGVTGLRVVPDDPLDTAVGVDELGSRIIGLAGRLAAATCRWLLLVAVFDARDGSARFGLSTTARWLTHYCGVSRRTAFEHVRVARALAAFPALAAAMSAGRLSYSQVRAISRVADAGGATLIDELINVAEHGTVGQLEDVVRGLRSVDSTERGADGAPGEAVSHRWRADSRWGLSAALDPEHGALVQSAIQTIAHREGLTHAQALTRIAEIALATATTGAAPTLRGPEYAAVLIHLDAAQLRPPAPAAAPLAATAASGEQRLAEPPAPDGSDPHTGPRAECSREHPRPIARIAGGPGLPDAVIHRLLCDGRIRTAVFEHPHNHPGHRHPGHRQPDDRHRTPLDLGRSHRVVSKKQFTALLLRDRGCTHPGCGSTHSLEAHHVRHWLHGGRTDLANLVLLCRAHHHAHHDGEFTITPIGNQQFTFHRTDGTHLPHHVNPARHSTTTNPIEDEHPDIPTTAPTTRWDGTRLDHHYAIATLAQSLHSTRQPTHDPWATPASA